MVGHGGSHRLGGIQHGAAAYRHHRVTAGTGLLGVGYNGEGGVGLHPVEHVILHIGLPDALQQTIQQTGLVQEGVGDHQNLSGAQHPQQTARLLGAARTNVGHRRGLGDDLDHRLAHSNAQL